MHQKDTYIEKVACNNVSSHQCNTGVQEFHSTNAIYRTNDHSAVLKNAEVNSRFTFEIYERRHLKFNISYCVLLQRSGR